MTFDDLLRGAWWIGVAAVVFFLCVLSYAIVHNAIWGGED